jgi:hypothetical protein
MTKIQGWIIVAILITIAGIYIYVQNGQHSANEALQACLASCNRNIADETAPYYMQALQGCIASCQVTTPTQ